MAKKILKGVGGLFGKVGSIIGGKKKKAAPVEETGPKITPLNAEEVKKRAPKRGLEARGTILSSTLGGIRERLGG